VPVEPELSSPVADGADANAPGAVEPGADATGTAAPGAVTSGAIAGAPVGGAANTQPGRAQTPAAASSATPSTAPVAGATSAGAAATAVPAAGKPLEVTLRFSADSWVEVYDAKGEKLFYDIGSADSQRKISGTPPFRVTFGNAPGVTLDVNGKPAEVPASAVRDDTAQFVINRSGRIVRARQQAEGQ
jgi:cytoskeleton protein RodZ